MTMPFRTGLILMMLPFKMALAASTEVSTVPIQDLSTTGLARVTLSLLAVLAVTMGAAWLAKRLRITPAPGNAIVSIVGGVQIGRREKVLVVEVAGSWVVLGVSPGNIQALSTIPKPIHADTSDISELVPVVKKSPSGFKQWLAREVQKRNETK
jgi:flagellar protein FliO/FliZ